MHDLGVTELHRLSHMIPTGEEVRNDPHSVSPSWVLVYRDLCEWAVLYERICYNTFATDTLLVRDGLLRSKLFRGEGFIRLRERIEQAVQRLRPVASDALMAIFEQRLGSQIEAAFGEITRRLSERTP